MNERNSVVIKCLMMMSGSKDSKLTKTLTRISDSGQQLNVAQYFCIMIQKVDFLWWVAAIKFAQANTRQVDECIHFLDRNLSPKTFEYIGILVFLFRILLENIKQIVLVDLLSFGLKIVAIYNEISGMVRFICSCSKRIQMTTGSTARNFVAVASIRH